MDDGDRHVRPAAMSARSAVLIAILSALVPASAGAAPVPLSADHSRVEIASRHGSGAFGTWTTDPFKLPEYRYAIDEQTAPAAAQPELGGSRDAWHQLGNDHVVAD